MDTIQIQLPRTLVQRFRQVVSSDEPLDQVVTDAIEAWLPKRRGEKTDSEKEIETLRSAGVTMASERQQAMARSMIARLSVERIPSRTEVAALLSKLRVPLSEEIIAMRGER